MRTSPKTPVRNSKPEPLAAELEARVSRFNLPERREVRRLVRSSPRIADLAAVFPGAIYAIASRRGPAASRLHALSLVEQGAPLKAVARALDLPLWLKRLPPEAFAGRLGALPVSETFTRRVATRIPPSAHETAAWLETVAFATEACSEDFALWLAEQQLFDLGVNFLRPQLVTIRGVAIPWPFGGKQRQIMVDLNTRMLQAKGLAPADVVSTINLQNLILPSGTAKIGQFEYYVNMNAAPRTVAELADLPMADERCGWAPDVLAEVDAALCRALAASPDDPELEALVSAHQRSCPSGR